MQAREKEGSGGPVNNTKCGVSAATTWVYMSVKKTLRGDVWSGQWACLVLEQGWGSNPCLKKVKCRPMAAWFSQDCSAVLKTC